MGKEHPDFQEELGIDTEEQQMMNNLLWLIKDYAEWVEKLIASQGSRATKSKERPVGYLKADTEHFRKRLELTNRIKGKGNRFRIFISDFSLPVIRAALCKAERQGLVDEEGKIIINMGANNAKKSIIHNIRGIKNFSWSNSLYFFIHRVDSVLPLSSN